MIKISGICQWIVGAWFFLEDKDFQSGVSMNRQRRKERKFSTNDEISST